MPPLRYLTKSLVRTALRCPRKLVYAAHPTIYPRGKSATDDPIMKLLSQEGIRFGEYCKRLFPHGVEVGTGDASVENGTATATQQSLEHLVTQTRYLLEGKNREHQPNSNQDSNSSGDRVTVFEGAICHGSMYVRPDILDKVTDHEKRAELRLIEVKSKSWDSRETVEQRMWTSGKKGIRSTYLNYIQDLAFQTMVCRLAYPDVKVSSWLMLPDRAKKMKCNPSQVDSSQNSMPSMEQTLQTIETSIACLLNVDELVDKALASEVSYPGGAKGEKFENVMQQWAEQYSGESFGLNSFRTPIGIHCASCEYRSKDLSTDAQSGFDACWQNSTGIEMDELQNKPLVVDLHRVTKQSLEKMLSNGKYLLPDLVAGDFDLTDDGNPKKTPKAGDAIVRSQRQWYQVQTSKMSNQRPNYIMRKKSLEHQMKKWRYPLHFIDFETSSPVIPHCNKSPYEVVAFQFSHHKVLMNEDGSLQAHHDSEFLHTTRGECPNDAFLKALYQAIGDVATTGGTVFQWSPYERNVLRAILPSIEDSTTPLTFEEISALQSVGDSMVDLCKLAKDFYYVDGSRGSSSIKRLLQPTLDASDFLEGIYGNPSYNGRNFMNFQWYRLNDEGRVRDPYEILSNVDPTRHESAVISHGGDAAAAFHELQTNMDLDTRDRERIGRSLLRYCELDTLAMVMIVQAWHGFLKEER
ncbi:hypothetical protein ACHAWF_006379 [Thalassiosira exigua]